MDQTFLTLRRTRRTDATDVDTTLVLLNVAFANRTFIRSLDRFGTFGPLRDDNLNNLRNDLAGFFDDDRIADSQTQSFDLIEVVERRMPHRRSGQLHRVHNRPRRNGSQLTHLIVNASQNAVRLLGCELVCDAPARIATGRAEYLTLLEYIHFDHQAIRLIRQPMPPLVPFRKPIDDTVDRIYARAIRTYRQAPPTEQFKEFRG